MNWIFKKKNIDMPKVYGWGKYCTMKTNNPDDPREEIMCEHLCVDLGVKEFHGFCAKYKERVKRNRIGVVKCYRCRDDE